MNPFFRILTVLVATIILTGATNAEQQQGISLHIQRADEILKFAISQVPDLENSNPDGQITKWLNEITQPLKTLADEDLQEEEAGFLLGKVKPLILLLEERRIFRYMLWAEKKLRSCSLHNYSKLTQKELFGLYKSLSDIDLTLIPENILAREIAGQLALIYDYLDSSNKPEARLESIRRNADKSTAEKMKFRRRKTLDDF